MSTTKKNYDELADWAESDAPEIHPGRALRGAAATTASRELLEKAMGGRPTLDPNDKGNSPRRQVRLPRELSDDVDDLAKKTGRSASEVMRTAIADYVAAATAARAAARR